MSRSKSGKHYDKIHEAEYVTWYGPRIHHGLFVDPTLALDAARIALEDRMVCLATLPTCATVLDVGCGYGVLSNRLARRGHNVVGITDSKLQCDDNYKKLFICHYGSFPGCVRELRYQSYDAVFSLECIEHVKNYKEFIRAAACKLNPDGKYVQASWLLGKPGPAIPYIKQGFCFPELRTPDTYTRAMELSGLHNVTFEDVTEEVYPTWLHLMKVAIDMGRIREDLPSLAFVNDAYETGQLRYGIFSGSKVRYVQDPLSRGTGEDTFG